MGDKAVTLDLANGDLDNQNGLLTAKGPLTLKRLRDLNNQSGEISSNLSFDVIARAVNNSAGKLISGENSYCQRHHTDQSEGLDIRLAGFGRQRRQPRQPRQRHALQQTR